MTWRVEGLPRDQKGGGWTPLVEGLDEGDARSLLMEIGQNLGEVRSLDLNRAFVLADAFVAARVVEEG